jgi:hypothetical protein
MMPDLVIAATIFVFLLALAVAAPIWGYDSRDGVESDDSARRAPWLYDRRKTTALATPAGRGTGGTSLPAGASLFVRHRHHHDDAELCHAALLCIS